MAYTKGIEHIDSCDIDEVAVDNADSSLVFDGDTLDAGVTLTESAGAKRTVASGRERVLDEKVVLTFDVIEGSAVDLAALLDADNITATVTVSTNSGTTFTVDGILNVNLEVKVGAPITYKCSIEQSARNIDDITDFTTT